MKIALTGATGFVGRYIAFRLVQAGHQLRAWYRADSDRGGLESVERSLDWVPGELGEEPASAKLVAGCDAVVHAALHRPGTGFRGAEGDVVSFVERNVLGTLRLIEAARKAQVGRFIFISTCAVHERILENRPLDETHPTWATSHYGAHKAAIEQFVHSYGLGQGYPICALRPSGVYGLARPPATSKWHDLVRSVVAGKEVLCRSGGKEVHAADVALAVEILLRADERQVAGQAFNCCDRYISQWDVAHLARRISGSSAVIRGTQTAPKNLIVTDKLRGLGMSFGGEPLLEVTIRELVAAANAV